MADLTLEINGKSINIEVPCPVRATCYAGLLADVFGQLYNTFRGNIFLEEAILEPSLIEGLVKILDQEVCRYVNQDINNYKKSVGEDFEKLTPRKAREALTTYYHDRANVYESYGAYLKARFPVLANLLTLLSKQFQEAMVKALTRINQDQTALQNLFLANSDKQYSLVRIISTHNDLHKAGQQVLILEFKPKNQTPETEEPIRLIYKPASVLVDMMFLGDIQKLKDRGIQDMPQLESAQSITEIINTTENKFTSLPSYLIYPREDPNVIDSYGYIEYLPHQPWPNNLEEKILEAIVEQQDEAEKQKRKQSDNSSIAQRVIKKQFDTVLIEAQKKIQENDLPCDYIARNEEEHQRYSYQCGVLAAMATAFGITDMHIQNLIISRIQPYLIDLEVSFNQADASIDATGFLDPDTGSMRKAITERTSLHFLNSIDGLDQVGISLPQKNQFYLLNPDGNKPILVDPVAESFNQGFTAFIELVASKKEDFDQWLKHPLVESMSVRVLPYATNQFIEWLSDYKQLQFLFTEEESLVELEQRKEKFFVDLVKRKVKEFMLSDEKVPIWAIFASTNVKDNFDSLNIPVFYMKVSENHLIDSAGNTVEINYKKIAKLCKLGEGESQKLLDLARKNYFDRTSLQFITKQINQISSNDEYREGLITTATDEAKELFKAPRSYGHTSYRDVRPTQELSSEPLPEDAPASSSSEERGENASERSALLFYRESGQARNKPDDKCCTMCTIL